MVLTKAEASIIRAVQKGALIEPDERNIYLCRDGFKPKIISRNIWQSLTNEYHLISLQNNWPNHWVLTEKGKKIKV